MMHFTKLLCAIPLLVLSTLEAKVMIFAHYFSQPAFVKYQAELFKQNLLDDYEFVVFEDSMDPATSEKIMMECAKYNVRYIHIPRSVFDYPKFPIRDTQTAIHCPSYECSVATQYIYDNYVIPSKDICMILDNDIFLVSPFSIEQYLKDCPIAYVDQIREDQQTTIHYMLPNFIIFQPTALPDKQQLSFNFQSIQGVATDSGGFTYFYLKDHPGIGYKIPIFYLWSLQDTGLKSRFKDKYPLLFTFEEWASHFFIQPDVFLHIRMGSNWSRHPKYAKMMQEVYNCLEELLSND